MSNDHNKRKSYALTADVVIPEQRKIVLKRLKPPPPPHYQNVLRIVGAIAKEALLFTAGLFRKPELVRHVAPGKPPEPEHLHRKPTLYR